jgi:hypothetical protein
MIQLKRFLYFPGFGGGSSPAPSPPPPPPTRSDADVQAAALASRLRRSSAFGRTETILAQGADEENPTAKRLLGTA